VLAELPAGLPSMLNNSEASAILRQAYVQHTISKYLCYRIFQPFLFSLGKRYDKADTLFQAMSNQLREKSTRKEAVWRHYTLLAGYTAYNSKKNQQVAAAAVIEEIASYVKPFADPSKMDVVTSGITRIVKYAVETWRYARMEREIVTASLNTDDTDADWWTAHEYAAKSPYSADSALANLKGLTGIKEVVIPLIPVFHREGTLPSLHRPTAVLDNGRVFSKGVVLYSDCLPVLHRKYELGELKGALDELKVESAGKGAAAATEAKDAEEKETMKFEVEKLAMERQAAEARAEDKRLAKAAEDAKKAAEEKADAESKATEEAAIAEAKKAHIEAAKVEADTLAEKAAKEAEATRISAEEALRVEAERKASEEVEAARIAAKEAETKKARVAAEEAAKVEAEVEAAKAEAECKLAEEVEAARIIAQETARIEAEAEKARIATAELEREAREELARAMADNDAMGPQASDDDGKVTEEEAAAIEAAIESAVYERMLPVPSVIGGVDISEGEDCHDS